MSQLLKDTVAIGDSVTAIPEHVIDELETILQSRLHGRIKNLSLSQHGDGLVIHGQTTSYYAKQLAQHAVMSSCDYPIYGNEIVVE